MEIWFYDTRDNAIGCRPREIGSQCLDLDFIGIDLNDLFLQRASAAIRATLPLLPPLLSLPPLHLNMN